MDNSNSAAKPHKCSTTSADITPAAQSEASSSANLTRSATVAPTKGVDANEKQIFNNWPTALFHNTPAVGMLGSNTEKPWRMSKDQHQMKRVWLEKLPAEQKAQIENNFGTPQILTPRIGDKETNLDNRLTKQQRDVLLKQYFSSEDVYEMDDPPHVKQEKRRLARIEQTRLYNILFPPEHDALDDEEDVATNDEDGDEATTDDNVATSDDEKCDV